VRRSIEFPVDPKWIANPTNSPLATPGARMAAASRTKLVIETIGLLLTQNFTKPPRHYLASDSFTRSNKWTVTLTRIGMGTVDPITGGATMKGVQDALARWCEVPNERDPIWQWVEPIQQEKRGWKRALDGQRVAVTGVRIELVTLEPGEDKSVVLADIDSVIARAKVEIKFREKFGKPTVHDLRDAAERVLPRRKVEAPADDDRSAVHVVACPACGVEKGIVCTTGGGRRVYGVHVARAVAAGIAVPDDDRAHVRPARASNGHRRTVPAVGSALPCWAALPWEQAPCPACSGLGRETREDPPLSPHPTASLPPCGRCSGTGRKGLVIAPLKGYDGSETTITTRVPDAHRAVHGYAIKLTRRLFRVKGATCWLYEKGNTT